MANLPTPRNRQTALVGSSFDWLVQLGIGNRDDGVRSGLQFQLDFGALTPIGTSSLGRVRCLPLPALSHPAIENDFDGAVGGKPLAKVLVQIGVPAGDDEQVPSHHGPRSGFLEVRSAFDRLYR